MRVCLNIVYISKKGHRQKHYQHLPRAHVRGSVCIKSLFSLQVNVTQRFVEYNKRYWLELPNMVLYIS